MKTAANNLSCASGVRVKLVLSSDTTRAMKSRASSLGLTLSAYVSHLAARDGLDAEESPTSSGPVRQWASTLDGWRQIVA